MYIIYETVYNKVVPAWYFKANNLAISLNLDH